ncbi:hypothetical protein Hamer_G020605 [Homarus americanus]|uniref:Uncharacterized protein n=1 Tax=Homarus americanus TaxID=6706 RepID=A0A8J5MPY4_HOMAM|nr:hypothetical protein Hamer_G020605 [Homarus americanus]
MAPPCSSGFLTRSLVRIPGSGSAGRAAGGILFDLSKVSTLAAAIPMPKTLPSALRPAPTDATPGETAFQTSMKKNQVDEVWKSRQGSEPNAPTTQHQQTASTASNGPRKRSLSQSNDHTGKRNTNEHVTLPQRGNVNAAVPHVGHAIILSGRVILAPQRQLPSAVSQPLQTNVQQATPTPQMVSAQQPTTRTPHGVVVQQESLVQQGTPVHQVFLMQQQTLPPSCAMNVISLTEVARESEKLRKENATLQRQLSLFKQLFRNKERLTSVVRTLGIAVV